MWDALQERHTETADTDGVIRDVYDGAHYQKHASFLSQPANISLLINTDGIAIFQSSKASLWPVWVMNRWRYIAPIKSTSYIEAITHKCTAYT